MKKLLLVMATATLVNCGSQFVPIDEYYGQKGSYILPITECIKSPGITDPQASRSDLFIEKKTGEIVMFLDTIKKGQKVRIETGRCWFID